MGVSFRCANAACQNPLRVKDEAVGKRIKCPRCGQSMVVPAASTEAGPREATPKSPLRVQPRSGIKPAQGQRPRVLWPWFAGAAAVLMLIVMIGAATTIHLLFREPHQTPPPLANAPPPGEPAPPNESKPENKPDTKPDPKQEIPAEPTEPDSRPKPDLAPLPADLRAAWKEAKFESGLSSWNLDSWSLWDIHSGSGNQLGNSGRVPTFSPSIGAKLDQLAALPAPQQKFGLNLRFADLTPTTLKDLARFQHLHTLILNSTIVTDDGLKELTGLRYLERLDLFETNITDAGLKELAALKQLKVLNIGRTRIKDAGLKELEALQQLEFLKLFGAGVSDAGLKHVAKLKNLQWLDIRDVYLRDAGLKDLAKLPRLHVFYLPARELTDVGLKHLVALKYLDTLHLSEAEPVTDAWLKELATLKRLQTLSLDGAQVTGAGLKELAGLPRLQHLELNSLKASGAGLKGLSSLKKLHSLNLHSARGVADADLSEVGQLRELQILDLRYTGTTDAGLKELAGLQQLKTLYLSNTKVTEAGVNGLTAALKNLRHHPVTLGVLASATKPDPDPKPPAKDGWQKDPAAFARLFFGDNLDKRTPKQAGPVKGAKEIEKKVLGVAVEWQGEVLTDVVKKTDKKILAVPFSKTGWIWVSELSLQKELDALELGSRVRVTMKLNGPILAMIAGDGTPLIILGGDDAKIAR